LKAFAKVSWLPEFEKDLKRLSKRFKTLEDDLRIFIDTQLNLFHKLGEDNGGIFQIPSLHIKASKFYKAKKFACRSLKGAGAHSGIRVIYTYFKEEDRLELIEVYYKGDKENEDKERIRKAYHSGR
jgi:mRNA-degrading endonuclease RelE of RelBE toxin-antitoxin system